MRPVVHVIGKLLRLVGISSPEDTLGKPVTASDPPSWRTPKPPPAKAEDSGASLRRNEDGVAKQ
jgi:hypothetical protein